MFIFMVLMFRKVVDEAWLLNIKAVVDEAWLLNIKAVVDEVQKRHRQATPNTDNL